MPYGTVCPEKAWDLHFLNLGTANPCDDQDSRGNDGGARYDPNAYE